MLREVIAQWPDHVGTLGGLAFNPLMAIPQDERVEFAEHWVTVS